MVEIGSRQGGVGLADSNLRTCPDCGAERLMDRSQVLDVREMVRQR